MIELNAFEQVLVKKLIKNREKYTLNRGGKDQKQCNRSGDEIALDGVGGELAFCKICNLYPDLDPFPEVLPIEDAVLDDGRTVDVKTVKYSGGNLNVKLKKKDKKPWVDLFVLMTGEFPVYEYVGCIEAEKVFQEKNLKDVGNGPYYAVSQRELKFEWWNKDEK